MKIIGHSEGWEFSSSEKIIARNVAENILSAVPDGKLRKSASTGKDVLKIFADALEGMGVKANIDIGEFLKRIASGESMEKTASEKDGNKEETIKIASKKLEESHFFIDVSKNKVTKKGKSLILVSAYMRDGYLGRYIVKRNYFFLPDNDTDATETFEELVSKSAKIKRRYYDDKISSGDIYTELEDALKAARGDIEFREEDQVGTTVSRHRER